MRTRDLVVLTLVSLFAASVSNAQRTRNEAAERGREAAMRAQERVRERRIEAVIDNRLRTERAQINRVHSRIARAQFDAQARVSRQLMRARVSRASGSAMRNELRNTLSRERAAVVGSNNIRERIRNVDGALLRASEARLVRDRRDVMSQRSERAQRAAELRSSLRSELQRRREEARTRRPDGGMSVE